MCLSGGGGGTLYKGLYREAVFVLIRVTFSQVEQEKLKKKKRLDFLDILLAARVI